MAWNRRKKVRFARGMWVGKLVAVSAIAVSLSLWYVWQRVQMVNVGYQIRAKERHLIALKKENQVLRMKIAQLKSPKNIEAMIRSRDLRLVPTKYWQMVVLPKETGLRAVNAYAMPARHGRALMQSLPPGETPPRVAMH